MNDEKAAVINMLSEETITSSEGLALFDALCNLEGMGSYESNIEVDDPRYLPPWESESGELHELLGQNKCSAAIACANQKIISALREEKPGDTPASVAALDVAQLSRFKPSPGQSGNGGFTVGCVRIKREVDALLSNGWGFWMSSWLSTDVELPPTWAQPMMVQIFMSLGALRLVWEPDTATGEEKEQIKLVSKVESFDDSVTTKAGKFHDCLKLKTEITPLEGQSEGEDQNMIGELRRVGTHFIWLAPDVGIVKFLYEHPNDTKTEIELIDYSVQAGEPQYFPLTLGNRWLYQWQDELTIHKELVRVFSREGDEAFALSCAKHIESIKPDAG